MTRCGCWLAEILARQNLVEPTKDNMGVEIGICSHVTQKFSMRIVLILAHKCAKIKENKMIIDY